MTATIINADVFEGLASLPPASVHAVVTSPPYWALRSYLAADDPDKAKELGSEQTAEEYLANMVRVFEAVRRVLRPDGICWVNLGDKYASDVKWGGASAGKHNYLDLDNRLRANRSKSQSGLSDGNQLLMPHRFALAMQAAGWCLRSTVIFAKRSPMPESISGWRWRRCRIKGARQPVTNGGLSSWDMGEHSHGPSGAYRNEPKSVPVWADCPGCPKCSANGGLVLRRGKWRPTTAHEYVFLFTPSSGDYFFSGDSAAEKSIGGTPGNKTHSGAESYLNGDEHLRTKAGLCNMVATETRNPRSVWTLSHEPSKEKHFATFPGELVHRCLAGMVGGGCSACGTPFAPIIETKRIPTRPAINPKDFKADKGDDVSQRTATSPNRDPQRHIQLTEIMGWRPCCQCNADKSPLVVLDPFAGTGTVGRVAEYLDLNSVLIELSGEYVEIMRRNLKRPWAPKSQRKNKQNAARKLAVGQRSLFAD